jgi:predicted ATPase
MPLWSAFAQFAKSWVRWRLARREDCLDEMRGGIARWREQKVLLNTPLFAARLAEAEAEAGEVETALGTIDGAIAEAQRVGQRSFDAELHRTRAEILIAKHGSNPAPAEASFQIAIAIAQAQKARSFELRAALSLAKLYHANGRAADAHAALRPALEGFAPTPEMPEIEEALALLREVEAGAEA